MSISRPVAVLGAGGHGKSVISVLLAAGYRVSGVYDDDPRKQGEDCLGFAVDGFDSELLAGPGLSGVIAVGDNAARCQIASRFEHIDWLTVIYPKAYVNPSALFGAGSVVFPGAVIGAEVEAGSHTVISGNATVGHEARLGGPGVQIGGSARLGTGAMMGIGSVVVPDVSVGDWTVVGAGAVVVRDLPADCTAFGVPARPGRQAP
jgi:sugar O-acyltransferase (sialic acid O-acetyltransferase NeuD family)